MGTAVRDHYEKLLGPVYRWMAGEGESVMARADEELSAIGIPARSDGYAIDLGAGFGMHAIPLAHRGYQVLAIDGYQPLLEDLKSRAGRLGVRTLVGDLLEFQDHAERPADVILCMGDTLTHLPDAASVGRLFATVAVALRPGGIFAVTFRDYVSAPLQGDGRFILVRSDNERILTCFLEYEEERVRVHDILHERTSRGWQLRVSSYPKLRLAVPKVVQWLESLGLSVRREAGPGGMVRLVARR